MKLTSRTIFCRSRTTMAEQGFYSRAGRRCQSRSTIHDARAEGDGRAGGGWQSKRMMIKQEDDDRAGGQWQSKGSMTEQGTMTEQGVNGRARGQ